MAYKAFGSWFCFNCRWLDVSARSSSAVTRNPVEQTEEYGEDLQRILLVTAADDAVVSSLL
jgi:hypothetical protein